MPMAPIATAGRVASSMSMAPMAPGPVALPSLSKPRRASSATKQSSKITWAVCEARTPSLRSLRPWRIPGLSFSMTKPAIPAGPALRSVVAKATWRSAMPPLVQNCLVPLST